MHGTNITGHSPFTHFSQLQEAMEAAIFHNHGRFVHFGWGFQGWYQIGINHFLPNPNGTYPGHFLTEMWEILAKSKDREGRYINPINANFSQQIRTRPAAVFAVHKERILANPPILYQRLKNKIMSEPQPLSDNARKRCCALESTWHVLFHEPAVLPEESSVDYLYEGWENWTYC